jgi:hypothetical protein
VGFVGYFWLIFQTPKMKVVLALIAVLFVSSVYGYANAGSGNRGYPAQRTGSGKTIGKN